MLSITISNPIIMMGSWELCHCEDDKQPWNHNKTEAKWKEKLRSEMVLRKRRRIQSKITFSVKTADYQIP